MKLKKRIFLIVLIFLVILSLNICCANENATANDEHSVENITIEDTSEPVDIDVPSKIWVKGNESISINSNESSTVNITGAINYSTTIESGKTLIPINLTTGKHSIFLDYLSSSTHFQKDYNITVMKDSPYWDMDFDIISGDILAESRDEIGMYQGAVTNVPKGASGTFRFYVNNYLWNEFNISDSKKSVYNELTYDSYLDDGNSAIFRLEYSGDDYFKPVNKTKYLNVSSFVINIPSEVILGYDDEIIIETLNSNNGLLKIYIDDELYKTQNITQKGNNYSDSWYGSSIYKVSLNHLKINHTYVIKAIFMAENENGSNYKNFTKEAVVNVTDTVYNYVEFPTWTDEYIYNSDYNYMDIKAPNLNFEIKIDNEKINYTYKDYYCRVELDNVTPGYHDVSVSYDGDELFARNTFKQTIEMNVRPSYDYYFKQNETGYFNLTLPQDTAGTLTVEIESDEYDYKIRENITVNGEICFRLPSEHIGYYTLKTHFDGNYEINDIKMRYYIESLGNIDINGYRHFINEPTYVILTLPKDAVGNLTVNVTIYNDENYTKSITKAIANGEVKIKLPTENNVTYIVDCHFEGNYEVQDFTQWYHVYFLELTAKDVEMYYCDGTTFKINVKSELHNWELDPFELTVKIGSNKYITYLEDGNAKIKLKELPGKYTITTTIESISLTMKNKLYIKPILTLKKVKIKKSAKKLVLTAKLAKKLKGKKITFKFNNKKYTAKTNSKGIAKVSIKKSVLKNLKVGKKLTYSATYIKSKVKKTVKISK